MFDWWESLSLLQRIFGIVAVPATIIMIIQTILVVIGVGDLDADVDVDGDVSDASFSDDSEGLALVSVRGIVAFFAVGGWTGIVMAQLEIHTFFVTLVALIAGILALLFVAFMIKLTKKLQADGKIDYKNAIGKNAKVYITIPADGRSGKVNLTLQGRFVECDAVTKDGQAIKPGINVVINGLDDSNTLIVSLPEANKENQEK
ncbi:MAG: hypothetical protein GXY06_05865 [Clostridiaceae bacterium]|nr:hypothetical protein [Clostridiaceae bacterium]